MSSIQGSSLLSSLRQAPPIEPTQRTQQVKQQAEETKVQEVTPLVPEEIAQDRYESSLTGADARSVETLNAQSATVSAEAFSAVTPDDVKSTAAMVKSDELKTPANENKQAPQELSTPDIQDTLSAQTAERVSVSLPDIPELQIQNIERDETPTASRDMVLEARSEPLQMESDDARLPVQDAEVHKYEPLHKQSATQMEVIVDLTDSELVIGNETVLPTTDMEEILPDPITFSEERAAKSVEEATTRDAKQVEIYRQEQVDEVQKIEIDAELEARSAAKEAMRADIPTAPEPVLEIEAQLPVDPVYSRTVVDQAIETGPQPSVASVATDGAIDEAVAVNQTMLDHYAPVETHTQPQVEVDLSKFEAPEHIDTPVPTPDPAEAQESQPQESSRAQTERPRETPVVEQTQGDAAAQALAEQRASQETAQNARASQQAQQTDASAQVASVTEAQNAQDYFPELPGSGSSATTVEALPAAEDYFPELPGANTTAPTTEDLPDAEDYFPPLPGSGESGTAEEFFPPLPGSGEIDGSGQVAVADTVRGTADFLAENPIFQVYNPTDNQVDTGIEEPSLQDFLGEGVSTLSPDDLAYLRSTTMSEYTMVENQFGANDNSSDLVDELTDNMGEEYNPFDVLDEEWVNEAINRTAAGHYQPYGTDIGTGEVDLTQFEGVIADPTDNTISAKDYIMESMDRVTEYTIERSESNFDNPQEVDELFTGGKSN